MQAGSFSSNRSFRLNLPAFSQTLALTEASLKVRYRQTWIGFLWVILNPLVLLGAQGLIFSFIFHISIFDYLFYFASGLLPWFFINQTLEMGTSQLRTHSLSIKAYFVKPSVFTVSLALENLINFYASILFIMVPLCLYENQPVWKLLFWFLSSMPLALAASAITFIASSSNVIYRDMRFVVTFLLSIAYFLTPIFYKLEILPLAAREILKWNPFYILISPFQTLALNSSLLAWSEAFLGSCVVALVCFGFSYWHWKKIKNSFYLNL